MSAQPVSPVQRVYNVHEAKTNLSKLLERVEAGETIVIARNGKPVAELVRPGPRGVTFGTMKGQIEWDPDTFDEPDEESLAMIDLMENGPI